MRLCESSKGRATYVVKSVSDHRGIYNLGVCIRYIFVTMGHVKRVSNGTQ